MISMARIWIFLSGWWIIAYGSEKSNERKLATCPAASITDSSGTFCCPESCGKCGGYGCEKRPGGAASCCTSKISKPCRLSRAPCIVSENPANDCPAGGIPDDSNKICCPASCGVCGGPECDKHTSFEDSSCCTSKIKPLCSSGVLPCRHGTNETNYAYCSNGMEGYEAIIGPSTWGNTCAITVCCPKSCGTCDMSENCKFPYECCALNFRYGYELDTDISCRSNDPPCVVPYPNDECTINPCQNGARCGISYIGDTSCSQTQYCYCHEVGNYIGQRCEIDCGKGETSCGYSNDIYSSSFATNDRCCTGEEECLRITAEDDSYYSYKCFSYDRPRNCSKTNNPCLNGGECLLYNKYDRFSAKIYTCSCPEGYEGTYCEFEK